jgi:maltose O-acetyltransferase
LIKRPIHIDHGENVHIHPSCFINRDCYIAHSPECAVSIGENTIVGVGARLLGVTHPIDWRERNGRFGMSLAADVKIGKECFVGAGVTLLHV